MRLTSYRYTGKFVHWATIVDAASLLFKITHFQYWIYGALMALTDAWNAFQFYATIFLHALFVCRNNFDFSSILWARIIVAVEYMRRC